MLSKTIIIVLLLLPMASSYADHKIKVMGLFTDKALVSIDGKQKLLKKGKTWHGVTLISSDSDELVLQMHGKQKKFKLGSEISTSFKQQDPDKELIVWKDSRNMFRVGGSINNSPANFLVDTGATLVALSTRDARKMRIKYKHGTAMQATTASGVAKGYLLNLDKVKVGHIQLYNVRAMVIEGSYPRDILLGQTFLERVHMVRDGDKMKLRKKF